LSTKTVTKKEALPSTPGYKRITFNIKGTSALVLDNGEMSNPLNPNIGVLKPISAKRTKTQQDHILLAKTQWLLAFYGSEEGLISLNPKTNQLEAVGFGYPVLSANNIFSMVHEGSKKIKLGTQIKTGISVVNLNHKIIFPEDLSILEMLDLFQDKPSENGEHVKLGSKFVLSEMRKTSQGQKVLYVRPYFPDWGLSFTLEYMTNVLDQSQVIECVEKAGNLCGVGALRPRQGKFIVESFS